MARVNGKVTTNGPKNDSYSTMDVLAIVVGLALTAVGIYVTREMSIFLQQLIDQL